MAVTHGDDPRPLDILGISDPEERVYRCLLERGNATVAQAAQMLSLRPARTQRLLDSLEKMGLVTHTPERPRRYLPAAPDIAMGALILQRQESLQRARGVVRELQEQAAARRRAEPEQLVELITSIEAERHIFEQIRGTARHEVVTLIRPPLRISRLSGESELEQRTQREAQARGVQYRSIVDGAFLQLPGAVARTRSDMAAGELVRVVPELPFKMMLADRRIAFVPLNLEETHSASLLVRSSALLDALYALFELLWERAAPISLGGSGDLVEGKIENGTPERMRELVTLMAAGLNDKAIAYELGISASTLNRRVGDMMKSLQARTRFQLGWIGALRLRDKG